MGSWTIRRVLGSYGHGEGSAKFTVTSESPTTHDPLVLRYREDMTLAYTSESGLRQGQGVGGTAYQEYVYLYDEEKDKITKEFVDGRHFYDLKLDLERMEGEGEHLCDKDFYRSKYVFQDCNHFTLAYDVKGPQKDYVIQTLFTKDETATAPKTSMSSSTEKS